MVRDSETDRSDTAEQLLDAALDQFACHGFAKTTMSDIATAAGLSRTSLYKHYQAKDAVFADLSQRMNQRVVDMVTAAATAPGNAPERLSKVVHARVGWVYDLLHRGPFGHELINEKNRICGGHILATNDRFQRLLADLVVGITGQRDNADTTARLITRALNGVLEDATSRQQAEADVSHLLDLLIHGLERQSGTAPA